MGDSTRMCLDLIEELEKREKRINQYKQKLNKLKSERDSYIDKYFLESQKVLKLNKALKEIKEIAEKNLNIHTCAFKGCGYDLITKQILQKISECEGNDE